MATSTRLLAVIAVLGAGAAFSIAGGPNEQAPTVTPAFAAVATMRDRAGNEADRGSARMQLGMKVFTNDPEKIADWFAHDAGAVMCQGTAYYLHLRYLEAGYRSYLVGFGNDQFTHAMALVEIARADGSKALVIEDPTFNVSYGDEDALPLSVYEIMQRVTTGAPITVLHGPPATPQYLVASSDRVRQSNPYLGQRVGPSPGNPDVTIYGYTETLEQFGESVKLRPVRRLIDAIFSRPLYVYHRYPMDERDKADADAVFDKLKALYAQRQEQISTD